MPIVWGMIKTQHTTIRMSLNFTFEKVFNGKNACISQEKCIDFGCISPLGLFQLQ